LTVKKYQKKIISDPDLLPEVEEFVIGIAQENNIDEEHFTNLALSVAEAASNSVLHGNKLDKSKFVTIDVIINHEEKSMTVILKDEGDGFNIDKVPDPTAPENILKESGRGIHIMRSFLAELKYNFTDSGTETILRYEF
jgi:serine/threonine-protein kinase RsbW